MADRKVVNFAPNPVQKGFIESEAKADLFASRVGEGKSTALVWSAFRHAKMNPGSRFVILRDTYENIKRTTMQSFFEWFPRGVFGTWNETNKEFSWASGISEGGSVTFMGMDNKEDASKLLSWELGGFAMDEPAPAVGSAGIDELVFDLAMTRLRQSGMKYYPAKLATNNPDESHWTARKFWGEDKKVGFQLWQPSTPENSVNLPQSYYEDMRETLKHRPDLIRRFIDGKFGFQQVGKPVTPQWSDDLHLANGLVPVARQDLHLLWDFGHNPTCIITQRTPMGYWLILESYVGTDIGVEELIEAVVLPALQDRYKGFKIKHTGDPQGKQREQTSIRRNAVAALRAAIPGPWLPGPVRISERTDPLQAVLSRTIHGAGVVRVDRFRAKEVWYALRGGWHYHQAQTGTVSLEPLKNEHSHPGDAMGYGAALLFPMGRKKGMGDLKETSSTNPTYFGQPQKFQIGSSAPGVILPAHGSLLKL